MEASQSSPDGGDTMSGIGPWSDEDVLRIMRRLNGGTFGQTTGDTVRAVLHAAEAVPASDLRGAVDALREAEAIIDAYTNDDRGGEHTTRVRLWKRRHHATLELTDPR